MAYPFLISPGIYSLNIYSGVPVAIPGASPFTAPVGPPQDESGVLQPAYTTQAIMFQVVNMATFSPAATGAVTMEMAYQVVFSLAGAVVDTFNDSFTFTQTGTSTSFSYTPQSRTNYPTTEFFTQTIFPATSGGAAVSQVAFGSSNTTLSATIYSPAYVFNLPFGVTATGTITITVTGATVTNNTGALGLWIAQTPWTATMSLDSDAVLTLTSTGKWLDKSNAISTLAYTVSDWDVFWYDGVWHRETQAGGTSATFNLAITDIGVVYAYVRIKTTDGFLGWRWLSGGIPAKSIIGVVLMPDGARIVAGESTNGNTEIRRIAKPSTGTNAFITLAFLSRPRLSVRDGVLVILGRVHPTGIFESRESKDGGTTWS